MRRMLAWMTLLLLASAPMWAGDVRLDVREHVLKNGMKLLMVVKPGVPRVVCHVYYKVGSINERPGTTGLAHLHEHMMFKGTRVMGVKDFAKDDQINQEIDRVADALYRERFWKRDGDLDTIARLQKELDELMKSEKPLIVKDDLWETYMRNGGTGLNASTSEESTGYYVTLPSNKLELQMLLEADRMRNCYLREFYSEKDVVMEERRLSENSPGFLFEEQLNAAFYAASPYHWEVLGWMDDLRKVVRRDMQEFHERYYVPNNAVAVYVGDFDPEKVVALAEKYFGSVPRGPEIEPIRTAEPPQSSHKRIYGEGPAASGLTMMFHIPPSGHKDSYALSILGEILSGETGRLYATLVKEKDMAVRASAFARPQWYAGEFTFDVKPKVAQGVTPEQLEKEVWALLERVKSEGITAEELQKAKNKAESRFVMSMQAPMGLASRLGRAELNRGWRSIQEDLDRTRAVTLDDVKDVAARYLVRDNATVGIYTRKGGK